MTGQKHSRLCFTGWSPALQTATEQSSPARKVGHRVLRCHGLRAIGQADFHGYVRSDESDLPLHGRFSTAGDAIIRRKQLSPDRLQAVRTLSSALRVQHISEHLRRAPRIELKCDQNATARCREQGLTQSSLPLIANPEDAARCRRFPPALHHPG